MVQPSSTEELRHLSAAELIDRAKQLQWGHSVRPLDELRRIVANPRRNPYACARPKENELTASGAML
jgi:hypothetical protein